MEEKAEAVLEDIVDSLVDVFPAEMQDRVHSMRQHETILDDKLCELDQFRDEYFNVLLRQPLRSSFLPSSHALSDFSDDNSDSDADEIFLTKSLDEDIERVLGQYRSGYRAAMEAADVKAGLVDSLSSLVQKHLTRVDKELLKLERLANLSNNANGTTNAAQTNSPMFLAPNSDTAHSLHHSVLSDSSVHLRQNISSPNKMQRSPIKVKTITSSPRSINTSSTQPATTKESWLHSIFSEPEPLPAPTPPKITIIASNTSTNTTSTTRPSWPNQIFSNSNANSSENPPSITPKRSARATFYSPTNRPSPVRNQDSTEEDLYCICRRPCRGTMIACDSIHCRTEWFHRKCAGLTSLPRPGERWFCPDCLLTSENIHRLGSLTSNLLLIPKPAQDCDNVESTEFVTVNATTGENSNSATDDEKQHKKKPRINTWLFGGLTLGSLPADITQYELAAPGLTPAKFSFPSSNPVSPHGTPAHSRSHSHSFPTPNGRKLHDQTSSPGSRHHGYSDSFDSDDEGEDWAQRLPIGQQRSIATQRAAVKVPDPKPRKMPMRTADGKFMSKEQIREMQRMAREGSVSPISTKTGMSNGSSAAKPPKSRPSKPTIRARSVPLEDESSHKNKKRRTISATYNYESHIPEPAPVQPPVQKQAPAPLQKLPSIKLTIAIPALSKLQAAKEARNQSPSPPILESTESSSESIVSTYESRKKSAPKDANAATTFSTSFSATDATNNSTNMADKPNEKKRKRSAKRSKKRKHEDLSDDDYDEYDVSYVEQESINFLPTAIEGIVTQNQ